jgi:hypothetical protein
LLLRQRLPEERSERPAAFIEQSTAPMEAPAAEIHDLPAHALRSRPDPDQAPRP